MLSLCALEQQIAALPDQVRLPEGSAQQSTCNPVHNRGGTLPLYGACPGSLQAEHASEAEWQLLVPALLASCSLAAAQAWLGYVPAQLQQEAAQVIGQLSTGSDVYSVKTVV